MEKLKSIIVREKEIRMALDPDDHQYKPVLKDLVDLVGLPFLIDQNHLKQLLNLLLDSKFSEAIKWAAYKCDCNTQDSKIRIIRYLAITVGCHLLCDQKTNNKHLFDSYHHFINGLSGFPLTSMQIVDMIRLDIPNLPFNNL